MSRPFRFTRPPRPLDKELPATLAVSWLGSDQQGSQVLVTARTLIAVEGVAKNAMPPALALVCKVARIDRQQITLAVPSAAYASRLRQLAPRILVLLNDNGWNLTEMIVRVQAGLLRDQTKTTSRQVEPLDGKALAAFDELQQSLPSGPLADAIGRLLAHHRDR
ncbi:flagellar hook-length control protein FliK [Pollutimonas nitritireducens]|uniref:Flagellar hook-length control protein FliK n=1 Tax=Pollutimonas nitritireducens TaxID=2045209 RepID=A0A2N4UK80_9BURK|nr:DciA family protein [Pollutimonas nitritireducens]PLC55431.1 flagellar hook-length control protein FliK [Pollutimonas nitritireducens]